MSEISILLWCNKLETLLPAHSGIVERALEKVDRWTFEQTAPVNLWNPDTVPSKYLKYLAYALSVDPWRSDWSDEDKRATIRASLAVHRIKGTKGAILRALAAINVPSSITEWFEYNGAPYHFRVEANISGRAVTEDDFALILSIIDSTKNTRSWLERLRVFAAETAKAKAASAAVVGNYITVQPWTPKVEPVTVTPYAGSGSHVVQTITIGAPND